MVGKVTGNVNLDGVKRLQVPDAIISIECPLCDDACDIELVDQIYYPAEHKDHTVAFDCEKCGIEVGRKVRIVSVVATFEVGASKII